MDEVTYPSRESLGFMTITANRLMGASLRRAMKDMGVDLTAEQWGVLVLLWEMSGATQEELAAAACVDKSSMSRLLSLMEKRGLITRRVDPANARRKVIRATDASRELRERVLPVARAVMARTLEGVSPEEHAACLAVLAAVKANLRKNGA